MDTFRKHVPTTSLPGDLLVTDYNDKPRANKFSCPNSLTFVLELFILELFSTPSPQGSEAAIAFLRSLRFPEETAAPYPDFADGVSEAFVVASLTERDGIELPLVEVGHGALPLLLAERLGGLQGVLKCAAVNRKSKQGSESLTRTLLINFISH